MKNFKTWLIVLFAIIIAILIFFLVKRIKNNNNSLLNDKLISEISFMDNKLTSLLNGINNITLENYKVTITKTSTSQNQESSSNENKTKDEPEQYGLETNGILANNSEVDWNEIQSEIETLYAIVPTMTLDLYNININQEDILNFNKELDQLTVVAKNKDKKNTLIKLANLYRYLPAYASNFSNDSNYLSLLETKSNIFKAYVFVNIGNWDEAYNYTSNSIESFSRALNNIEESKKNGTNKIYIILNEILSAVNIKDKDVFFIKYKSFIEETDRQNSR